MDPTSGQSYDYGVQVFSNLSVVHKFFSHFEIPLVQLPPQIGGTTKMVNFETGEIVPPAKLYAGNLTAAMLGYAAQQEKYKSIFESWENLPFPVPEDLLMPFGDFLKKHDLEAMAYVSYIYDQGLANILKQPTLYVMKYQDRVQQRDLLGGTFVVNALQNNQLLYDKANAELAESAYLQSYPKRITRHSHHVEVEVETPDGREFIKAAKLLVTTPPKSSIAFLDLDHSETSLLKHFNTSYYWNAVMKNTGIPDGTTLPNVNPDAAMNLPAMPGLYTFLATPVQGLHATYYSSPHDKSTEDVAAEILTTLEVVREGAGYAKPSEAPEFVAIHKWSPFEVTVPPAAIRAGFYQRLPKLQGRKNTWWTGAAWMNQATSTLWRYTEEEILPHLVDDEKRMHIQFEL
jgi:hypothetical protein